MKFRLAMLILMIAAQPVQAGFCVMDLSGGPADQVSAPHHADGDGDADSSAHDCCATSGTNDIPGDTSHCAGMSCGTCAVGAPAIVAPSALGTLPPAVTPVVIHDGVVSPSHTLPPFRPPISIS